MRLSGLLLRFRAFVMNSNLVPISHNCIVLRVAMMCSCSSEALFTVSEKEEGRQFEAIRVLEFEFYEF